MSAIEHRIERTRELLEKGKYYIIMDYNIFIIHRHSRGGKFTMPSKREMYRYEEYMDDLVRTTKK